MSLRFDVTRRNQLGTLNAVLGQQDAAQPAGVTYQQVWDRLFALCSGWLGEDECRRLLGYKPFLCPPTEEKPITANWWFWLGVGGITGLIAGKLFL